MDLNLISYKLETPIGLLYLIASSNALIKICFETENCDLIHRVNTGENRIIRTAVSQFNEYFSGIRKNFTIPLMPQGTAFQKQVWQQLPQIPYGKTISYQELAASIGDKKKARAVGSANSRNPIPVIIPCHRVIRKNGSLGGYSRGIEKKRFLLRLEGNIIF